MVDAALRQCRPFRQLHEMPSAATTTDIRECGQCHWQMCRRCWDLENCQCTKCRWMADELPEALRVLVAPGRPAPPRSRQRVAGHVHH